MSGAGTECATEEMQCEFGQGGEYMDQVFALRQVCEIYQSHGKDVFLEFMD